MSAAPRTETDEPISHSRTARQPGRHILYVSDEPERFDFSCLGAGWTVTRLQFPVMGRRESAPNYSHVVINVNLSRSGEASYAQLLIRRLRGTARLLIACDENRLHSERQAWSLGADALIFRPLNHLAIRNAVLNDSPAPESPDVAIAAHSGSVALAGLFSALEAGTAPDATQLAATSDAIVSSIGSDGVHEWLSSVWAHHDGTYQHCLLVAGVAAGFARELGLSSADSNRLTLAALVHDVGKIRIPHGILEKPSKLTDDEYELIKKHPEYGWDFMRTQPAIDPDVLDAIRHHHEMLDGSGYPDGLTGNQIGDGCRIITICDVFSALVERRSYKPGHPPLVAFDILSAMVREGKLETALVKALAPVVAKAQQAMPPN